jgi:hypothetical protein
MIKYYVYINNNTLFFLILISSILDHNDIILII